MPPSPIASFPPPALWLAALGAAVALPLAVVAPLGEVIVALLVALPLIVPVIARDGTRRLATLAGDPLAWLLAALLLWAALASLWAPSPAGGLGVVLRLAGITTLGLALRAVVPDLAPALRGRLLDALVLGYFVAAALIAVELFFQMPINRALRHLPDPRLFPPTHLDRVLTMMAVLVWPIAWHLLQRGRRGAAMAALALALLLPPLSPSRASVLAMLLAVPAGLCLSARSRRFGAVVLAALVLAIAFLPVVLGELWQHHVLFPGVDLSRLQFSRLGIWDYAFDLFRRRPLGGWGMDASRWIGPDQVIVSPFRRLDLHPHNALLQVALELGLPGLALALTGLALVVRRILAIADPAERAIAAAEATAFLAVSAVSYGVWQFWWHAVAWLAAAFLAIGRPAAAVPSAAEPGRRAS